MSRRRRWLIIGTSVAVALFVTGLVRGLTNTVPFDPTEQDVAPSSALVEAVEPLVSFMTPKT